jgi:hypothetical protein
MSPGVSCELNLRALDQDQARKVIRNIRLDELDFGLAPALELSVHLSLKTPNVFGQMNSWSAKGPSDRCIPGRLIRPLIRESALGPSALRAANLL